MFVRELELPLSELKGAGPALLGRLAKLGVYSAADLLLLPPRDYEDRAEKRALAAFAQGPVNCFVRVQRTTGSASAACAP